MRSFVVCAAVLFLACTTTPEGLCEDDSGCLPGLRCDQGVCVGCGGDDQCQLWEACSADRRCELRAGMCAQKSHCQAWEVCGADNTCQLAQGSCLSATDCKSYEDCDGTTRQCVLQEGRCTTSDSCGGGDLWAATCGEDNYCHSGPPAGGNDVLIWGTLSQGICGYDAISSVTSPTRVQVGFECDTYSTLHDSVVSPGGRIYYVDGGKSPNRVKVLVPDKFPLKDGVRSYPKDGTANDTVIPAPACGDGDVGTFIMQGGTGSIAYTCFGMGSGEYYSPSGEVVLSGHSPLAWNAANYVLARGNGLYPVLLTPERTAITVTGVPITGSYIDARAQPTGFLLALSMGATEGQELWRIDHDGVATRVGKYGAFPEEVFLGWDGVLDSAGALYARSYRKDNTSFDVVVKRTPDGTVGTIVYDEGDAKTPVNGGSNYERLFNFMHGSYLFTGP